MKKKILWFLKLKYDKDVVLLLLIGLLNITEILLG
eukprot:CAMPEP_0206173978 /NCGR_PEP_ID=MMETSP1474-20131121/50733_1 /ASSEMBLY_ACC=CAM_ASM_001110 /TAXON_ID=97495 /ORGANISM="Imantonia sp., Strain RCC918" /LENGTH=34 /DNA_ID= /DNA_START= /DNA_END= /DNA_ORIENTATION=